MKPVSSITDLDVAGSPATTLRAPSAWQTGSRRLGDFIDLAKPRLNFLVIVTTAVGFYLASRTAGADVGPWLWLHTLLGTALTAGAASALNQLSERDLDARMRRTRRRSLPSGKVRPIEALVFGLLLATAGVAWLAIFVNPLTAVLGLGTLLSYVVIYTPLKTRTPWCTLIGAVPGAIPPMMGVTAVAGTVTPLAWSLFAILFVWQMPHFFSLAMLYCDDYAAGGFRMLPGCERGGLRTRRQIGLFSLAMLPVSLLPLMTGSAGVVYVIIASVLGLGFVGAGLRAAMTGANADMKRLFLTSIAYLPLLLAALMIGH